MIKTKEILESIKLVVKKSKYVKINYNMINSHISLFNEPKRGNSVVSEYIDFKKLNSEEIARFFLILQSIDFCFWGIPKWSVSYKDKEFSGFYGITVALIRAIEEGYNILDFDYLKNISKKDLEHILRGIARIPLFEERLRILHNITRKSLEILDGKVYDYFLKANSDEELLNLITNVFTDFNDVSMYEGEQVCFFKKATLLVYDLFSYLPEVNKKIRSVDNLIAGADYKLPQVLRFLGILEYSNELEELIDNQKLIEHDSKMEIEIRANTIYVVDLIKNKLKKNNIDMSSFEIGTLIWLLSKRKEYDSKPYHLSQTIFY